jgi:hypothetical protein
VTGLNHLEVAVLRAIARRYPEEEAAISWRSSMP